MSLGVWVPREVGAEQGWQCGRKWGRWVRHSAPRRRREEAREEARPAASLMLALPLPLPQQGLLLLLRHDPPFPQALDHA